MNLLLKLWMNKKTKDGLLAHPWFLSVRRTGASPADAMRTKDPLFCKNEWFTELRGHQIRYLLVLMEKNLVLQ